MNVQEKDVETGGKVEVLGRCRVVGVVGCPRGWKVELEEAVGVARVCLLFGGVVRGETEVVWHTENGGGTCVE